jgi:uncharacterized protein
VATSSVLTAVWLVLGGVLAGVIGSAGGITSLVSYPALLAAGVPALGANVANLVAVVACWPASALASRRELSGSHPWLVAALPTAAIGGCVGSRLLLSTPPGLFLRVVPFLVAAGSVMLLIQPVLTARHHQHRSPRFVMLVWVGLLSVYGGYFGAGSGVMTLALLLSVVDPRIPQANALKNMLIGAAAAASASIFIVAGPVAWSAVVPLAVGMFAGSVAGPVIARRLPAHVVRWAAASLGFILAVELWVNLG